MIGFEDANGWQAESPGRLLARPIGIDTHQEPVIYMRADCAVCRAEGFDAQTRVSVTGNGREFIATLNVVRGGLLAQGEAGLSDAAWSLLGAPEPDFIEVTHANPVESFRSVRGKLYGHDFTGPDIRAVVTDIARRRYSDVQLSAFLAAGVGDRMSEKEIVELTRAMVDVGARIEWPSSPVFDKHCIGGLPGNRTTPLVVAIVSACGLVMPKTSSRAITSPAGTADTMGVITRVDLSLGEMRRVVEREGGCFVWGGAVELSPADDLLIRVERALDLDSDAQLVASVLSKKIAAGSTCVLIDVPVGPTAKVRDARAAERLSALLSAVGSNLGIQVEVMVTDGSQPVGRGVGPALEARDVLAVLRGERSAPDDLRQRAAALAGAVLEQGGKCAAGAGVALALEVLADGRAWKKFQAICDAQGGLRTPPEAAHIATVVAQLTGSVSAIDNRRLSKLAKLAGAPDAPAAGVVVLARVGDWVERGQGVLEVHAESRGELAYALDLVARHPEMVAIADGQTVGGAR